MYYLQSRYYDPEIGRFIIADLYTSTGQGVFGSNMFAYCNNCPISRIDPSGSMFVAITPDGGYGAGSSTIGFEDGGGFSPGRNSPLINLINNDDPEAVISSKGLSFYRGIPYIKFPNGTSAFSAGMVFMGGNVNSENLVLHEYGHTVQLREIGLQAYLTFVVVPSVTGFVFDQAELLPNGLYFSLPWEYKADEYGGAEGNYTEWAKPVSDAYWSVAKIFSAFM